MGMEEILTGIANVGFPITITLYLLHRVEVKLDKLCDSINKLIDTLNCSDL